MQVPRRIGPAVTERRVVTVLALATAILVGYLLFAGGDGGGAPNEPGVPAASSEPGAAEATPTSSATATGASGVKPVGAGRCPRGHRVKGVSTISDGRLYYRPGETSYGGTRAEECFATGLEAETAGFLPAPNG